MGSIIPKINIGINGKRSTNNMSFDSQTTTNIGFIQPTMARMLIPDSSIKVKHRSLVRLAAMVNPTFGRLSQRDYFTFVKMSDIYRPWLEYLNAKPYTTDSGNSYVPENLPTFYMADVVRFLLLNNSYISVSPVDYPDVVVGINEEFSTYDLDDFMDGLIASINNFDFRLFNAVGSALHANLVSDSEFLNDPFGACSILSPNKFVPDKVFQYSNVNKIESSGLEVVNVTNSDFSLVLKDSDLNISFKFKYTNEDVTHTITGGDWMLHFRLKPFAKNIRKILIGLGYGFNPWDTETYTPFSLIAYYKSWFDSFYPLKTQQFTDTKTYKFIKKCESADGNALNIQNDIYDLILNEYSNGFYYYTQPDYFSASQYNLGDNTLTPNQSISLRSPVGGNIINTTTTSGSSSDINQAAQLQGSTYGLSLQIMLRLLRFTNKNNVIGRNLRDFAKIHFGIDDIDSDNKSVTKINACRTDIYFDDVLSQAKTNEAFLGEYAGYGIGSTPEKKAPVTFFNTKDWGFFFCMSVLVPESGYYQGSLKENKIKNRFEFFMPEFDALGYDVITRGEIKNDFDKEGFDWSPSEFDTKKGFGFIPRYTHFKVGRNIVNGDLTLGSTKEGLQGYFLDKQFPSYKLKSTFDAVCLESKYSIVSPDYLPEVVTNNIRKIDPSDNVGNYNRIFQYQKIDFDHFVIQKYFEVKVTAPWKSVSDSFDTINSGEDTIERDHV